LYTNSLIGVEPQVKAYYVDLKAALKRQGYKARLIAVSGRRLEWDNYLLSEFGGAAKNSKHKSGFAIDVIVLDVNDDGAINSTDVNIVHAILNQEIIKDRGGLGTYKNGTGFFSRQMVHFDCRGSRARWNR
jgi:uncharacterized protein YcbK (DUF882 family)